MKILALDSSTRIGSVALAEAEQLIAQTELDVDVTHTEKLLPAVEEILKKTGWELENIEGFAVAIGPGSFTGLRVGLATMKGFALSHNRPLVGISSLEALAMNGVMSDIPVAALLDAKRGEVYAAVYQFERGIIKEILFKEQAIKPEFLSHFLKKLGPSWLIGDGALAYREFFEKNLKGQTFFPPHSMMRLQSKWIAWLALPKLQKGEGKNWASLTPNYLRLSDAERTR